MKKLLLCSSLFLCAQLAALPEGGEAVAGDVAFMAAERKLTIEASDKAIINYAKFHVGRGESVEFVQPSSKATVLNRVKGREKSKILGELRGNGRVFLVNPNGIYFGPKASVNVGSFVASTLDILDDDFLQDRFQFFMQPGSEGAKIINKGAIRADESVALFAPYICNSGSVLARAGKVVLAAAEKVTLDFSGDGLIQFTAEGALRNALIEQYGQIEAGGGAIELSMYLAKRAIKMVVNTDGVTPANTLEEVDGIIRLEHRSTMVADQVVVDGGAGVAVEVEGEIKGKEVRITGDVIRQSGSLIDVSSEEGGGTVLIGGDFRGEGELHHAMHNLMDEDAVIKADALVEGSGGTVVLWADQILDFDGQISVRGGPEGGDGGLAETSVAGEPPSSQTGHVDAGAPKGKVGDWLIDPSTIVVNNAGTATLAEVASCSSAVARTINVTTINTAAANVVLCAQTSITTTTTISMGNSGTGITFRASGTGASAITTTLGGNITTNGGAVTFDLESGATSNSVLLNFPTVQISTSSAAISINGTVNSTGGTRNLTLSSGSANITFFAAVGDVSPLGALTVTAAGVTTFSGTVSVGSATLQGTTFNVNNSFAATGAVAVTNSSQFTTNSTGAITAPGGFSTTGAATLANNITTTNSALTIGGTLTIADGSTITLTSGTGHLTLSGTANGLSGGSGETLVLDAAGGTIDLAALGSGVSTRLTTVTITNSGTLNFNGAVNITGALTQTNAATGATTFSGTVAVGTATLRGTTYAVNNSFTSTGAVAVTNSGLFTKNSTGTITATGGFSTTGNVSLANNITATNNALTIGGTLTIAEGRTVTLTSGTGHLTLSDTADGTGGGVGETLILNAAGGTIDLAAVGSGDSTKLRTVTITNSGVLNFNGAVNITGALTQTNAATGTTTFSSTVAVGSATLRGTIFNVNDSLTSTGAITVTNSGLFTKSSTGALNAAGGLSISGASNLGTTVTTTGGAINLTGPVTMAGSSGSFDTTNGGGTPSGANITFGSTLNGAFATVVDGGAGGAVLFTGAIGGTTPLTTLTATGVTVTQSSTSHIVGALQYTGPLGITIGGTTTTDGATITLTGPVIVSGSPTFDTTNGGTVPAGATVTFSNTLNGATSVTLRAGTGGNTVFGGAVGGVTPLTDLTFTSANQIWIADNMTLSGASNLIFPFPVIATGISTITSTNKNITFNDTLNGDAALTRTFRCAAGTGSVVFSGVVGDVNPLSIFGITSANDVTATTITAGSLVQNAGSGTSTFNGAVSTSGASGISLTGTDFTFNNTVTTTGSGGMTVANSGLLSLPVAATLSISGAFAQTGAGSVQSGNTITAAGIQFTGAVALTSAASYTTTSNLALSFGSTIDSVSTTPIGMTINVGSGNVTVLGNIGSIHPLGAVLYTMAGNITSQGTVADGITINSGTGLVTTNGNLTIGAGGIHITGNNFASFGDIIVTGDIVLNNSGTITRASNKITTIGGNFQIIGSGPAFAGSGITVGGNVLFNPAVTLGADAIIDTSAGGGTVIFNSTINGTRNLTFVAGASPITLSGNVGFVVPLGTLTITGGSTISTQGIQAASIVQTAGTGTTTFNGALTVSGPISVSTVSVVRGAAVTTTGGGAMTVTLNGGSLTSTAAGAINLAGAFTQNGTGTVSFGGSLTTANAAISFNQQVALASPTTLSSGSGAGDITLSQGAQGATTLVLNSGTGSITLGAGIGTTTPLTGFTISSANNVSTQGVSSAFITQSAGTGTTTFNGAVNTTGASGIALTGNNFTFSNTFTTGGGGAVTIVDSGVATFNGVGSIAGALTVNGATFASTITAGGAIAVNGAATVSGTAQLTTQAANQPITFFSTLNGPGNLTLSSGTADLTLSGVAGGITALGDLTISTVGNLSTQAVTAASILQSTAAPLKTSTFNGLVTTTGSISLTGVAFTFLNGTAATGAITVANSGLLLTTVGNTILGGGGFAQTGAGAVSLAGAVQATNNDISFASPITLIGDATLNSGTSAGDITLTTVNENFDLTLTAGRDITLGVIGGGTRIDTFTITSARNVNASAITAKAIVQQAGSGTTFINGALNTNTAAGIQLTGTNFTRSANITTTNSGSYSISNSGAITAGVTNTTSIDGSYTQTAIGLSSSYNLGGTLNARLGISISSPVTLLSDGLNTLPVILDTSSGNGNIIVTSTINNDGASPHTFIVRAGVGDVTLSGAIGGSAPIGPFKLGTLQNVTTAAVSAASVQQELGATLTGLVHFNGTVTTTDVAGVSLSGNAFTFHNVTTTGGGAILIANTGLLTLTSGSILSVDSTFTQSGAGNVSLGSSITTTNDTISFAAPVTVVAAPSLNTGAGIGDILFNSTVNGAGALGVAAGVGDIMFLAAVGQSTPLSSLTAAGAVNLSFSSNVTLTGLLSTTGIIGPTIFTGAATAGQISLSGGVINLNQVVTTTTGSIAITNTGLLTVGSMAPIQSATSFTQTGVGGTVSLGANVTTTNFAAMDTFLANVLSFADPISLTSDVVLDSGGADIIISNTVGGAFDFTLIAGGGDITLSSTVGAPRLADFIVGSADDISMQSVTAQSIAISSVAGTATLLGSFDTNTASGVAVTCNNFTTGGTITTTNGGPLTITNSGIFTASNGSIITLNGGGTFTQNGSGTTHLGGSITTQNAPISYASAVQVLLPAVLTSNNGNILFSSTVDGPACLTLSAGTGAITFVGPVGSITPLGCLTASGATITQGSLVSTGAVLETGAISLSGGITTSASAITLTGNVVTTAAAVALASSGGPISITGNINGDVAGRDLTIQAGAGNVTVGGTIGNATHFDDVTISGNTVSFAGLGNTAPGALGITTITATTNINFTGTSYNNGTQNYTAGSNFNFNAGASVTATSAASSITFTTGTIQLAPATDLTINTHGGNLTIGYLLGTGRNFTVDVETGAFNFTQIGAFGDDLNVVTLTAGTFNPTPVQSPTPGANVFATTLIINSPAPIFISTNQLIASTTYNAPVIIVGNISYTCGVAGTITFSQSVDANTAGVDSLTFDFSPCGGSLVFNGPVGATTPLASISVNAATDVTTNAPVFLGSFLETGGFGTAAINAGMTTTAVAGVLITSADIHLASSLSTAANGPLIVTNTGTLTIDPGTSLNISGAFQQLGGGSVSMGGTLTTHDNPIQFADPITLTGVTSLSSKSANGADIIFTSAIDGAQSLTLLSGVGDIFFSGIVGGGTPLDSLQITQAHDVTASAAISAKAITQVAGSGTSTFDVLNTTTINGILLTGSAFSFTNDITTAGSGPLVLTNSGLATFGNHVYILNGGLTQTGAGTNAVTGSFTASGNVSFGSAVALTNTTTVDTSAAGRNISFSGVISGAFDLDLTAGTGSITFAAATSGIGALTVHSAHNWSAAAISAASITQIAGSGVTTLAGNITTTGLVSLSGTNFTINSPTTSIGAAFTITNSGPLALTLGSTTSITGAFTQSGGGSVLLAGKVQTVGQNISFADPITLSGSTTLTTGAGPGDITLTSAVNGTQNLQLSASGGALNFGSTLGVSTPIGNLTIVDVNGITYPEVHAASITQQASNGTTVITGPFATTGTGGVSITGGAINQNGAITTTGTGGVTFVNSGLLTVGVGVNTMAAGNYSQSGGGSVSLGGFVTVTDGAISFADPVDLAANIDLVSGVITSNSNGITFSSAVTGAFDLNLTAVGGSITCSDAVGTVGTPLTAFNIVTTDSVSTQDVFADTITQQAGTGTSTFNGTLTANAIALTGTGFAFKAAITTTGAFTLTNLGLATFDAAATGAIGTAFLQNGSGTTQLSSAITTTAGTIAFTGPVTSIGTATLDTQAANQSITFHNTVNGPGGLTLAPGTGDITFDTTVGFTTRLGTLSIPLVGNLTLRSIRAASIIQLLQNVGAQTTFNGTVDTNGAGGINLSGENFLFVDNVTTTGSGNFTISHSGFFNMAIGKTLSIAGSFAEAGAPASTVSLGSSITTGNANLQFTGSPAITLTAPISLNSGAGVGDISFAAGVVIKGHFPLTMTAGLGDITAANSWTTLPLLGAVTIVSADDVQFQAVSVDSFAQQAGTGTTTISGALSTTAPAGVSFIGNNLTLTTSVVTTNGGSLTVTNQGTFSTPPVDTLNGAFIQNGPGPVSLRSVTARLGISCTGAVTVPVAAITLDTSAGTGGVLFGSTVNGASAVTITAGSGSVTFSQAIGSITPLTSISATGGNISIANIGTGVAAGVTGSTTLISSGDVHFTGTTYHANTQTYTAITPFMLDAGALTTFSSGGSVMTFTGPGLALSTGTDLTMNTGGAALTLGTVHAQSGNQRTLIFNTTAAALQIGNIGTSGAAEIASTSFTCGNLTLSDVFANTITFAYTGTLNAGGDLITVDTPLLFPAPVNLTGVNIFSTFGTTGANITFSSTVNSAVINAFGMTLRAGAGDITFSASVGATRRLGALVIATADDVTLAPLQSINAIALIQQAGTGTTTFNGPVIIPGPLGIQLTGNNFTLPSTVQTLNNASLLINNTGTLNFSGTGSISGAVTQNIGPMTFSGAITAGQIVTIGGLLTLSGTPSISTAATNQSISINNTVSGSGALTLAAGSGGDITFLANVGTSSSYIGNLTVSSYHALTVPSVFTNSLSATTASATGVMTASGSLNTQGAAGIQLTGHNFQFSNALNTAGSGACAITNSGLLMHVSTTPSVIAGSYTQTGAGAVTFGTTLTTGSGSIAFASPVTLAAATTLDSSAGNQNITFSSTIDGTQSLLLAAGAGDVTISDVIGADIPLTTFTVASANDIQLADVGTTAIGVTATMSLTASNDINLQGDVYSAGAQIYMPGNRTNLNAGMLTALTTSGGPITMTTGEVHMATSSSLQVITNNGDFAFTTLTGTTLEDVTVNTGTGLAVLATVSSPGAIGTFSVFGGQVTFAGPIDPNDVNIVSQTSIMNIGPPVLIQTPGNASFNALNGDVGTIASPIFVQAGGFIFAGAGGRPDSLAVFNGTSSDNTVYAIPSNPPCTIIFNGVIIKQCTLPSPSGGGGVATRARFPFPMPGADSSYFNWASDYYFFSYLFTERFVKRTVPVYSRAG